MIFLIESVSNTVIRKCTQLLRNVHYLRDRTLRTIHRTHCLEIVDPGNEQALAEHLVDRLDASPIDFDCFSARSMEM